MGSIDAISRSCCNADLHVRDVLQASLPWRA
jgi:hypothetical protein